MKLGTSSLRRRLQAKFHLNAKNISSLNGNIDTRIKKLDDGKYDCIILAEAGLKRLEHLLEGKNFVRLNHISCSGQGALAVQWKDNNKFGDLIMSSDVASLYTELNANIELEKSLLKKLKTNCNSAISIKSSQGQINGEIYGIDKFIAFKGTKIETIHKEIVDMGGLKLLNDHNWYKASDYKIIDGITNIPLYGFKPLKYKIKNIDFTDFIFQSTQAVLQFSKHINLLKKKILMYTL